MPSNYDLLIRQLKNGLFCLALSYFLACTNDEEIPDITKAPPQTGNNAIIEKLRTDYNLMAEEQIAVSNDETVYAQFTDPVTRYAHGILGDQIEASRLVVVVNGAFHEIALDNEYVFEDIRPRLFDVDSDGELEFITIRTHIHEGAGIVIYKVVDNQLEEFAYVNEIGTPNRWLNIVTIYDLDQDGIVELAWIQTPHIGGILKVAKIRDGKLLPTDEASQYSNHAIGETNLCLSELIQVGEQSIFYVPAQNREGITGFFYKDLKLNIHEEVSINVDFSKDLMSQYNFQKIVRTEDNCINP
ncbi:hypothetical protein FNH22_10805 [Fulvivirga sp. M361]|uniref:hypothetical protein n=1 Tax=Fulvivirga sp. M361 TaxID=2594266 RepID=UPI00117BCC18|nr:hypothetical protein [Fulvivirga sp. M361]TRX59011.1 hypothetical protein FNH22_10805 [Fulvivirga sp. M361]